VLDLETENREGTSIVAFGLGLADANNRNQACADCGYGLGASGCVGFAMVRTTLGVTDDDEGGANVLQHFCRDVTRVRAKWPFMARLPPDRDRGSGAACGSGRYQGCWRTNQ
jgi:hypothetical protein